MDLVHWTLCRGCSSGGRECLRLIQVAGRKLELPSAAFAGSSLARNQAIQQQDCITDKLSEVAQAAAQKWTGEQPLAGTKHAPRPSPN